ncbi:cation diffusion facilitator family transporter [Isoptericola variabilis]|uniref:cation diffusion facilitator family transporter n=1 Tax=Isoptericola variabilis TaxID=139208 RepID=UPI0006616451|nr:cation diffusion facilitator family transporter [Isoptericola variabilis]
MFDSNPTAPHEPTSSRVPAPASSHIDEAVAHSHEHAHFAGGGHGGHGHDHSHAGASAKRLGWALAVTGAVVIAELLGAFWSGSLSLAADAGHMVVDASGLVVALVAAHLTRRPRDEKHTWGWARSEVLAAALQAGMLLIISVMVAWEAAWRLASPPKVEVGPMLLVGVIGLLANVVSLAILAGGRDANLNMKAAFLEVANDALGSFAVILAAGAEWAFGWARADAIASLLIAVLMAPRALSLLRRSLAILMEQTPATVDITKLRAHMLDVDGVLDVHDLHVAAVSSHLVTVTAHVTVSEDSDGPSRDLIVHQLGECACHHFPIAHSTFQLECAKHREHEHLEH